MENADGAFRGRGEPSRRGRSRCTSGSAIELAARGGAARVLERSGSRGHQPAGGRGSGRARWGWSGRGWGRSCLGAAAGGWGGGVRSPAAGMQEVGRSMLLALLCCCSVCPTRLWKRRRLAVMNAALVASRNTDAKSRNRLRPAAQHSAAGCNSPRPRSRPEAEGAAPRAARAGEGLCPAQLWLTCCTAPRPVRSHDATLAENAKLIKFARSREIHTPSLRPPSKPAALQRRTRTARARFDAAPAGVRRSLALPPPSQSHGPPPASIRPRPLQTPRRGEQT